MRTTGLFVAAAAVSLGLAWVFRPVVVRSEGEIAAEKRGTMIFPELDPDTASSFQLTRYNESMATLSRLELSKDAKSDLWTLPSADGYPADSAEQVSQAMTPLVELKVLSTVSTDRGDHVLYGVVEPNEQELTVSASGVGILVKVGGIDNKVLASLIIGKKVDGTENQHFVRVPSEDAVYEVEIGTDAFSTELEKWIKGDILNVRSLDIEYVGLRDYAILRTERGFGLGRNFDADLNSKDNKWTLSKFVDHTVEGSPATDQPPEGKKLQDAPLNELKNNIQNLKIVSVRRKPPGLAADLKADKSLLENEESTANLQSQGFFPMESGDVYAAGGELLVGTMDGVRYLLRFGNTRVSSSAAEGASEEGEEAGQGVNRYLLVSAQLDESKFPAPELKVVPESIEEMLAQEAEEAASQPNASESVPTERLVPNQPEPDGQPESADSDSDAAGEVSTEPAAETPAEASSPDDSIENPEANPSTEPATGTSGEADVKPEPAAETEPAEQTEPAVETVPSASPGGASEVGDENALMTQRSYADRLVSFPTFVQEEPQAAETSETGTQSNDEQPKGDSETGTQEGETELAPSGKETQEELQERLEFLQETLRKENQRLIDARNDKLNEARKKVAELNARFAEWYYIVSDSVYNKLKVSRDTLFLSADANDGSGVQTGGPRLPELPAGIQLPTE